MKKNMKKIGLILSTAMISAALAACGTDSAEQKTESLKSQHIEFLYADVTKFYNEETGKIVYMIDGTQSNGVAMIDGTKEEGIPSDNFLEIIEEKHIESLYADVVVARDKDNGNIVVISDGTQSGGIDVQKPKE